MVNESDAKLYSTMELEFLDSCKYEILFVRAKFSFLFS